MERQVAVGRSPSGRATHEPSPDGLGHPVGVPSAELIGIIRPFVNAKLNRQRDPNSQYGAYLPRTAAIDISDGITRRIDADVRAVTDEGVQVFFYGRFETIPWDAIRTVTVASLDADENRTAERVVWPAASMRRAA